MCATSSRGGAEGHHLHDPLPGTERRGRAIAARGGDHLIFGDVAVRRGQQAAGEAAARAAWSWSEPCWRQTADLSGWWWSPHRCCWSRYCRCWRPLHPPGCSGSAPLYSRMRMSGYAAAVENVTVTVLAPAAAAAMFLA